MLSVSRLAADAAEYYLSAVATNTIDYYTGNGEPPGRWSGRLAPTFGLGVGGEVSGDELRRLLAGLHPQTGIPVIGTAGSNARARTRTPTRARDQGQGRDRAAGGDDDLPDPGAADPVGGGDAESAGGRRVGFDALQTAAQLEVTVRAVRHWTSAGEQVAAQVRALSPDLPLDHPAGLRARYDELHQAGRLDPDTPRLFLFAGKANLGRGRPGWRIAAGEIESLQALRHPPVARAGWDLVFRPPKSYSILWALTEPARRDQIQAIHHQAVDIALGYLEDDLTVTRTTHEGRQVRAVGDGLIVARFDHRDSRAGDPLLHSHCVIANITRVADQWLTIDPRGWYRNQQTLDALYQATFRYLAEHQLGLVSEPVVNGWADLEGVPRHVVEHFSKRRDEITAELARLGTDSPAARQAAALATRAPKRHGRHRPGRDRAGDERTETGIPADGDLHGRWQAEAAQLGFDPTAVEACFGRANSRDRDREPRRQAGLEQAGFDEGRMNRLYERLAGPDGLTATTATFTRGQVIQALATALAGQVHGADLPGLADRFLTGHAIAITEQRAGQRTNRVLGRDGQFHAQLAETSWSTPEIARIEADLITYATTRRTAERGGPTVDAAVIAGVLADRADLSGEQQVMVRTVCASRDLFRPVVGYPGAGKTHATRACVDAFTLAGHPVVGCAVTAEAADELARGSGLAARPGACDTLARLLLDLDHPVHGGLRPGTIVICDEASTLNHRDLHRLTVHVHAAGGALVLIGDPAQHGAIGPGQFFAWLTTQPHLDVSRLTANHRQRDILDPAGHVVVSMAAERAASLDQRDGRIVDAFRRRDTAQTVRRAPTATLLYTQIVDDWWSDWTAGRRDPMITSLNSIRAELNQRARQQLAAAGHLTGPVLTVTCREFQVGDEVLARHNDRRLRDPSDRTWFVRNGSRGTIRQINHDARTALVAFHPPDPDGEPHLIVLPARYLEVGHLDHAYAVTDYSVQGRTLDTAKALITDTTSRAGAYVALTRGRHENLTYVVDGLTTRDTSVDPDRHGPARPVEHETTLDQIARAIAEQPVDVLVHEIDPHTERSARLARMLTLAQLHHRLTPLETLIRSGPGDVSRRLAGLERQVETLTTRRRLLQTQPPQRSRAGVGSWRRAGRSLSDRSNLAEITSITAQLDTLTTRRTELETQAQARADFLDGHATDIDERDLLRSAIAKRELHVRLTAHDTIHLPNLLTDRPGGGDRVLRRDALEHVALYRDRWSSDTPADLSLPASRPADREAAVDWDRARRALTRLDPTYPSRDITDARTVDHDRHDLSIVP